MESNDRDASAQTAGRTKEPEERTEAELRQAQKLQAIGTLAGGIAHDFNNILYAITGYAEIIAEDLGQDHPSARHVTQVLRAAARGSALVQKILAFSRPSEPDKRAVDLARLVEECTALLMDTLPANIRVRAVVDDSRPSVLADYSLLQQVLLNLGTNAFHATREAGGHIDLQLDELAADPSTTPELAPGRYARISVRDDGVGMPPEVAERVFEPFFTTKPPGQGSGLGLSTAHGIIDALDGHIRVRSVLGKGTTFEVYLPLAPSNAPAAHPTPPSGMHPVAGTPRTIMVVDDEPAIAEMLDLWLGRHGHTVVQHTDPGMALEALRSAPNAIDLLITDQTMPEMSGLDLARAALALRPDLPVILATGYSDSVDERQALSAGVRSFVMKPFRMKHLETVLQTIWP